MRNELASLIARLEAAQGPDRELDRDLAEAVGWERRVPDNVDSDDYWRWGDYSWTREDNEHPPRYTASIDEAVALVERLGPNYYYRIEKLTPAMRATFNASHWATCGKPGEQEKATASTPAIALLLALLRSLRGDAE